MLINTQMLGALMSAEIERRKEDQPINIEIKRSQTAVWGLKWKKCAMIPDHQILKILNTNREPKGDELPLLRRYKDICKWQRPGNRTSVKQMLYNKTYHFRHSHLFSSNLPLSYCMVQKKPEKKVLSSQRYHKQTILPLCFCFVLVYLTLCPSWFLQIR